MRIDFPRAEPSQSDLLSDIAVESKGYWGHSRAQLEAWRDELRIEEAYIAEHFVRTILVDGKLVGFFAIKGTDREAMLDHLWLLPEAIGKGIGKRAFERIVYDCRTLGIEQFVLISDPDAEGFYLKQGATKIGEVASSAQNRMLPKLRFRIEKRSSHP